MRCARRPKALPRCHIHAFIPTHLLRIHAALFTPYLCSCIHAALKLPRPHRTYSATLTPQHSFAALTPPHLCCSSHAAAFLPAHSCRRLHGATSMQPLSRPCMHAAALTLQHSRRPAAALFCRTDAAALMPSLSRRSIGATALKAAAFMQHLARHRICRSQHLAANLTLQHSSFAFTLQLEHHSIYAAALVGALCRWKRTTRSAFSNAEHDASGREPARAGAGRGGAGRGGAGGGF